ncbi:phragmoplast orienting kinesin-1-like [Panicum miliaceum]|uniref:Phragmoplast orienting kinesin-1-like n=1 Tax=Panicum miliaceum TaxID=4540 RepID=A0A3L6QRT4_PANMI|nr:phragmoplast orienting kinesin-1-like [Panicum miliaceum]
MAAPGATAGGRRASASRPRRAAAESNENDDLAAAPSSSSSALAHPAASVPHFSLPPRSPLAAIADPGRNPRSAPVTPKSLAGTPRACAAGTGARDRISSFGTARRVFDLRDVAAPEVPLEVPHFELDEDPAFWKDRNVQVLIRIRPISDAENATHGHKRCLLQDSSKTLSWTGPPETMFTFDHVACETISQEKLFRVVGLPMVENCMSGYNGCLFAYGQTGSGKTYTMMGELAKLGSELSKDAGLTPRIFEYLFARINEEEERRREEKLKYICKCSFLEIYNEQITDLLEPSSTNLQIREDIKKGVYVENLMECYVSSVKDVMLLLLQGVANRKMAATNMNRESSRSHSVFTCVIESCWESDSMTHLRFGRLNLVDLAGSERQKSSGAEGERLKEAANINRSLSTLGLVIMTLVDVANGRNRHVPYRDSRLTFLLQDSLGGNSKTTIVANVSPSICSSSETLSTLKFAQRAKLIQNNVSIQAKVNEDASGDIMALQRQIEELKDQLTCLKKQQSCPGSPSLQLLDSDIANEFKTLCGVDDQPYCDLNILKQKVSHLEDVLVGSLRREKSAETKIGKLEAEIQHLNRLVNLMESDAQRLRRRLELRGEKQRLHSMDENAALSQEVQLLQEQINENPQLTHFALENKRLIEELTTLQNFYKQGEREMLLTEISLLRNHFLHILEQKYTTAPKNVETQGDEIIKELDNCRKELDACLENNVLLAREVNKLRCELIQYQKPCTNQDQAGQNFSYLSSNDVNKQFMNAGTMTNISESFQLESPYEIDSEDLESPSHLHDPETRDFMDPTTVSEYDGVLSPCFNFAMGSLHNVLDKNTVLNEANFLEKDGKHHVYEKAPEMGIHLHDETLLCQEIEMVNSGNHQSQDELEHLKRTNQELKEKLVIMAEESNRLSEIIVAKDVEIASLSEEWEAAIFDLTSFLTDGCRSLDDAYQNIDNMISSLPHSNSSVSEHVEKAMKVSIEKEKMIFKLQIELQAAQKIGREVKEKLHILRGATLAITEAQQLDNEESSQEELKLVGLLHQKDCIIQELKNNLKVEKCLSAEMAAGHSCDDPMLPDSSVDMIEDHPDDENRPTVSQADPDYQSKLDSVIHLVEDKSNKVLTLFSNFEAAQETMEEAELMLSALLKANEELKFERDNCRQAVELLLSEKTSLIGELKELEASSSCASQRYDKFHQQINDCVVEMAKLAATIRGSFQQMQRVSTVELFALCSEIITFGQELKRCINESRSYIVDMVSLIEEKGIYTKKFWHLNANACGSAFQHIESHCHCGSSKPDFSRSNYSTDYASLRREFDRKNNIAEGLSFDLKLLQESTSNAKDMKDKADEISTALSNIQRELDIKTNAMENMLEKQKALEEELAENGAELTILRSELEQSQSLSSALLKENKDLRAMLDEETVKSSEIKVLLEDKDGVIEGLESQILLLNRSEVGQLMSEIEELNNSIKIMSSDKENLQAEILTLRDKLEMAMALSEENEAAAIEARQTAETSKIYAEEKEEEVKILERSVEELEGTITVLEEEVCNLKEEVRNYQLHKQSEDQLQAVEDMLSVEKASKCDAAQELCQGRCRLEKRLQAEILAHQDIRKKIEGITMEAKRKDDEIRQYKEHIAELVLHSEAQSLLYQEKYHELEQMVSRQKFSPHESSSETVHAKIEKPSGRARGSGSPFRCISSIVQQMNSEKDQEISVARQRIEELEGLVSGKQKEICLLTSRLAAVDTMTHDIIMELLGVKLDMTNYANLLDQEELQKLLIASQQQVEQSKAKGAELEVLKEELGHLILERDSLLDDMDQRKTDLLETQLLVEQLEQREQMLEAQIDMLQMEKDNLQQKIMEMDETMELLLGSNQPDTNPRMGGNQHHGSSELSRRLAQSDMLLSYARHEHSRSHATRSSRTHHGRHR